MKKTSTYLKVCLLAVLAYFFVGEREVGKYVVLSQDTSSIFFSTSESPSLDNIWDMPFAAIQSGTVLTTFQELSRLVVKIGRPAVVTIKSFLTKEEGIAGLFPLYLLTGRDAGYYVIALRKLRI